MTRRRATAFTGVSIISTFLLVASLAVPALTAGPVIMQGGPKRPLTHADYDSWRSIQSPQRSRNVKYVAYALVPQEGDGEIVVRNIESGKEWRHSRGSRPEPTQQPDATGEPGPPGRGQGGPQAGGGGGQLSFTPDNRNLVFTKYPSKADTDKAKRQRRPPAEPLRNGLGLMDLSTGNVAVVERVRRFQVAEDSGNFIAYLLEPKQEERRGDDARPESPGSASQERAGASQERTGASGSPERRRRERRREYGSDLVLRNLADNGERVFADVIEFSLSDDGSRLVYAVSSRKEETNGVYAVVTGSADQPRALLAGPGKYSRLIWDDKGAQLAFLSDHDEASSPQPKSRLYLWDRQSAAAVEAASAATAGI